MENTLHPVAPHRLRPGAPASRLCRALASLALLGLLAPPAGAAESSDAPSQPYSLAEKHLFMADHLKDLPSRTTILSYSFSKTGSFESGYDDRVTEEIGAPDPQTENGRPVKMDFLSGAHKLDLPPVSGAKGNPVIMGFLERDVREMSRITGGGAQGAYYRNSIRRALVEVNQSRPVKVSWKGKELSAEEFSLEPYKNDPVREKFLRFANKKYTFVLSDQVPGGVYSMKTVMRDSTGEKIMIEETLTLTETKQ